ncbi:MAG: hypothetical protein LWW85_09400 [Marinilabiliales bacterium]|nr:hypothetical protein [Marinilabiliales bacterium]
MSYSVPDRFFETAPAETLKMAKAKQKRVAVKRKILFYLSAAASIALLFTVSLHREPMQGNLPKVDSIVFDAPGVHAVKGSDRMPNDVQHPEKLATSETSKEKMTRKNTEEDLRDILSEISDDELGQLAAFNKADLLASDL